MKLTSASNVLRWLCGGASPARGWMSRCAGPLAVLLAAVALGTAYAADAPKAAPPERIVARPLAAARLKPPPEPRVKPIIARPAELDTNGDKIDDQLKPVGVATLEAAQNEPVRLELVFSRQITQDQINAFLALGGTIEHIYQAVSYGFSGVLAHNLVDQLPVLYGDALVAVVAARPVFAHLEGATRNGRVRPVWASGFAGSAAGFTGNSNITICVMDTGIDPTHADLTGRLEFWHDYTADAFGTAQDPNGHGSHCSGIALGTGVTAGLNPTTLNYTDNLYSTTALGNGSYYYFPVKIPDGTVTFTSTAVWTGGTPTLKLGYRPDGTTGGFTNFPNTGTSGPVVNSFTATSANHYSAKLVSDGSLLSFSVRNTIALTGGQTFGLGDGFNAFRGVAPSCRLAGARVLNAQGSGTSTNIYAAIDDIVAQGGTHNIKVVNMSFGNAAPGDATERAKVNTMVNNGILVAASAGNGGGAAGMGDPASAALALTVGATNRVNAMTYYSNGGISSPGADQDVKPDLSAPGGSVYYGDMVSVDSNTTDGDGAFTDGQTDDYAVMQGTSMASPFAAGSAALVIDALQQSGLTWSFSSNAHPLLVKMLLCATATETNAVREVATGNDPTLGRAATPKDIYEGYGILNVDAAIECVGVSYGGGTFTDSTAGGQFDRRAWGRKIALVNGSRYKYALTVPGTGDLDLYLYSGTPNSKGNPVILASSTTAGNGSAESINYLASATQTGYLVIKRVSGSGTWSLTATPTVTSVTPNSGANVGGTDVTVAGAAFQAGATVVFDTTSVSATFVNAAALACSTPPHAVGAVTVTVYNPDGVNASLASAYTYDLSPAVSSVSPNLGTASGGQAVTVGGANFATVGLVGVKFGATPATGVSVTSASEIHCTTPAHVAAVVDVTVVNPDAKSGVRANAYTYFADWEGDTAPRVSGGDGAVSIADWVQTGRFAALLDTVSNGLEFQKCDCAGKAAKGDGSVGIADWVQAGRYAAALDDVQTAGGPTVPAP